MSAYRTDFDETECMYFIIKIFFDKYMEMCEKVNTKINSGPIYSKKYLIAKKTFNPTSSFLKYKKNLFRKNKRAF